MNFTTTIIKHADVSEEEITEICKIKAIRWNYTLDQHRNWLIENIDENDYHLIIKQDSEVVAYTNLVDVVATINNEQIKVRGIGNVCTAETGKGYGNILMDSVNKSLLTNDWVGLLLCKSELVQFYEKFDWIVIEDGDIVATNHPQISFMLFEFSQTVFSLKYQDRNF